MGDIKIKIDAEKTRFDKSVTVMVNGQKSTLAVNQEMDVPEHVVEALRNANVPFETLPAGDEAGAGGGVSAASAASNAAPLTDTATRMVPNIDPLSAAARGLPVPTLLGADGTDEGGGGVSGAQQSDIEREQVVGTLNAEGQGVATSANAVNEAQGTKEADTDREPGDGAQQDEATDAKFAVGDKTIDAIKAHVATIDDKDDLAALLKDEAAGKNRTGASDVINARITELG